MHTASVVIKFCAMHRLVRHQGKCRHIHGHNYKAIITLSNPKLDELGMVVDFSDVKRYLKNWIDENWDHNSILNYDDNILKLGRVMKSAGNWVSEYAQFDNRRPYVMSCNPTAENMAKVLYEVAERNFPKMIEQVTLFETDDCFATYSKHDTVKDVGRVPIDPDKIEDKFYNELGDGG